MRFASGCNKASSEKLAFRGWVGWWSTIFRRRNGMRIIKHIREEVNSILTIERLSRVVVRRMVSDTQSVEQYS